MSRNPYIVDGEVRCAGPNCGAVRGATNHWFGVINGNVFLIAPWKDEHAGVPNVRPVCGEGCALKLLSAFMGRKR